MVDMACFSQASRLRSRWGCRPGEAAFSVIKTGRPFFGQPAFIDADNDRPDAPKAKVLLT
jgi:hypothetical protein